MRRYLFWERDTDKRKTVGKSSTCISFTNDYYNADNTKITGTTKPKRESKQLYGYFEREINEI